MGKPFSDPSHFARVLVTNGHMWRLVELHDYYVKKTKFLSPLTLSGPLARSVYKSHVPLFY